MIYPKFLKEADTIGVTAPSAGSEDEIDMNFNLIDINTKNIINLD